jgi:hypothetical protein
MEQEPMQEQGAVAPWLLWTLVVVIIAAVGYFGWNFWNQSKSPVPTPVISSIVKPTKTVTPTPTTSAIVTAAPTSTVTITPSATVSSKTPPPGWKIDSDYVSTYRVSPPSISANYSIFIKDGWSKILGDTAPAQVVSYGTANCTSGKPVSAIGSCLIQLNISRTAATYGQTGQYSSIKVPGQDYYLNIDFATSVSAADRKIILDSIVSY